MKNFICFCLFLSAVFCFAAEMESRVEKSTDSVLASVNGEPISLSDILFETQNEEYYMANALDKERAAQTILELRKKTLEQHQRITIQYRQVKLICIINDIDKLQIRSFIVCVDNSRMNQ